MHALIEASKSIVNCGSASGSSTARDQILSEQISPQKVEAANSGCGLCRPADDRGAADTAVSCCEAARALFWRHVASRCLVDRRKIGNVTRSVVTGADGLLGTALLATLRAKGLDAVGVGRRTVDLERPETIAGIAALRPDVVFNCAAWTDVDGCARDPDRALRINGEGAGLVAEAAARSKALVVQISTNEVFEGITDHVYAESDPLLPINPYGVSKAAGERSVASATDRHLIIRTAWLFGPNNGFPARIRRAAAALNPSERLPLVDDEWGNPTPVARLAPAIVQATDIALGDSSLRTLHLAGNPRTTRYDWGVLVLRAAGRFAIRIKQRDYSRASTVPSHAVLLTARAVSIGIGPIRWEDIADGGSA